MCKNVLYTFMEISAFLSLCAMPSPIKYMPNACWTKHDCCLDLVHW